MNQLNHPPDGGRRPWAGFGVVHFALLPDRASLLIGLVALLLAAGCANTAYDQGAKALRSGDTAAAIARFDEAIAAQQRVFEATRERGAAHLEEGDFEAAILDLEAARRIQLQDARLQWLLGESYARSDRPAEAAEAFRRYEGLSRSRRTREAVNLKVAQLETELARTAAEELMRERGQGVQPAPNTVAVYAFSPEAGENASLQDQKICRALSVWVSADLAKVHELQTLAADQLELIYKEQDFTYEKRQYFHPASLVAAGNLQPAQHMVRGLYGSFPDEKVTMGAACFDASSNETAECSKHDGKAGDLFDLETDLVLDVLQSIGISPTAEERIAIGEKPTRNLQAFLAFADGVYLRDLGNLKEAAEAFRQATQIDPGFSMAADMGAQAVVAENPQAVVEVPAPPAPSLGGEQAMQSALQLGLGLIPEEDTGQATDGNTTDIVTVHGRASLRVTGRAGSND